MKFRWGGEQNKLNSRLVFSLSTKKVCTRLIICAADFYQVYLDGEFISYGPERTAAGYSRKREISLNGATKIDVIAVGYNVPCYACDFQSPFFGAQVYSNNELIYDTDNFDCYLDESFICDTLRFSTQRGFVELYDYKKTNKNKLSTYPVSEPIILEGIGDISEYKHINFSVISQGEFGGYQSATKLYWEDIPLYNPNNNIFNVNRDFIDRTKTGFNLIEYSLESVHSGFIGLNIKAKSECEIFITFSELESEDKNIFCRKSCNNIIAIKCGAGEKRKFISFEPYSLKFLNVIYSGQLEISPFIITLENNISDCVSISGDKKLECIFEAARNTFKQNAVDIFMDCPGRERAGWLCDSYFSAIAELFFTGDNNIEKLFLENFLIADTSSDVPQYMLPKCFPSEHKKNLYIPNWAMWFVIELNGYFERTGDINMVNCAKEKVYNLITFFDKYVNEFGLLEDLESWVFVEWSIANDKQYLKGVNFPSNMLFAYMLNVVAKLYDDNNAKLRAEKMFEQIVKLSFNGKFFIDNAVRENGELVRCQNHISETCQYYALFIGICPNEEYKKRIECELGPFRKEGAYPEIGESNMFIGYYLRLLWLCDIGSYDRVLDESVEYFYGMAKKTGTLWEKANPLTTTSCDHGFASVISVILARAIFGFKTVKNKMPIFDEKFVSKEKRGLKIIFNYGKETIEKTV